LAIIDDHPGRAVRGRRPTGSPDAESAELEAADLPEQPNADPVPPATDSTDSTDSTDVTDSTDSTDSKEEEPVRTAAELAIGAIPSGARRWLVPAGAVLGVAIVGLLVVIVVFTVKLIGVQSDDSGRADALAAAHQAAVNLTSFNFETAVEDVARLRDSTTPHFEKQFNNDQNAFIKLIRDGQVRTSGTANEAGLVRYQPGSARVLVAVRASVQNTQVQQPDQRNYRMAMNMVLQNGKWLADSVEFIP
jgi:Mce-associated membrane protein